VSVSVEKIGDCLLYHGDCMDILPTLDKVDWCVTSPPYNLNKAHSVNYATKTNRKMTEKYSQWYSDDMPEDDYQEWQKQVIGLLMRVVENSIFYNHRIRYAWHARNKNAPKSKVYHPLDWLRDFPIWCEIIWDRCGTSNPTWRYGQGHEMIYQIKKPKRDRMRKSLGMTDVWRIAPARSVGHVCSFPEALVENCLVAAHDRDSVLDPFMGAGTAGVVCVKSGRPFVGIEKDSEYFDLACLQISRAYDERRFDQSLDLGWDKDACG